MLWTFIYDVVMYDGLLVPATSARGRPRVHLLFSMIVMRFMILFLVMYCRFGFIGYYDVLYCLFVCVCCIYFCTYLFVGSPKQISGGQCSNQGILPPPVMVFFWHQILLVIVRLSFSLGGVVSIQPSRCTILCVLLSSVHWSEVLVQPEES